MKKFDWWPYDTLEERKDSIAEASHHAAPDSKIRLMRWVNNLT